VKNPLSGPLLKWLYDHIDSIAETPHLFDLTEFETAWTCYVQSHGPSYGPCSYTGLDAGRLSQAKRTFWKALTAVVHRTIAKVGRIGVTG
jgi:hypothetical protein